MYVICPECSFYYKIEISGRRQQADCPQCGVFPGRPDHEGGLVVKIICGRCALGYAADILAPGGSLHCSGCGAAPKQRDGRLLERLAEVYRLRSHESSARARHADAKGRVNLDDMDIQPDLILLVPASIAVAYCCVPIRFEKDVLTVVLAEPVREGVLEDLSFVLKCRVHGAASPRATVQRAIRRWYGKDALPA
ncbi:MAG: GspE/PulE/PilB domain-containing protein [Planctomycetota bacterium]